MAKGKQRRKKISWKGMKTVHGYAADEVISALQKDIRRGNAEDAAFWAYEMMLSGQEFEKKMWERLIVISVEDVGLANPNLVSIVKDAHDTYFMMPGGKGDRHMRGLFAAVVLAKSPKDRFMDEMYNNLSSKVEEGYRPDIPDYALDKHTKRGKQLGRGEKHFWTEGSKLENESPFRDKSYLQYILKKIRKKK
ncbi:MAG: AAA family ATPase [Candidatus Woesearchaeota archaeon]